MLGSRRARGDDTLYARATPQRVELTETYSVDQEISRSPAIRQVGDGTGRIEVDVPYDGREYFTRQAVADVERVIGPRGGAGDRRATTGHLLLADHTRTTGLRGAVCHHCGMPVCEDHGWVVASDDAFTDTAVTDTAFTDTADAVPGAMGTVPRPAMHCRDCVEKFHGGFHGGAAKRRGWIVPQQAVT